MFILATVFGGIAAAIENPLLGAPDTLPNELMFVQQEQGMKAVRERLGCD